MELQRVSETSIHEHRVWHSQAMLHILVATMFNLWSRNRRERTVWQVYTETKFLLCHFSGRI